MGLRYPDQGAGSWFFVTTTFKGWRRFGDLPGFYERLAETLEFCLEKYDGLLAGYVLMPSHIHLVIGVDGRRLGELMRDFKKYTGRKVADEFGLMHSIWMPRYDRVVIASERVMRTKIRYCHENPVEAGLAGDAQLWKWSSAVDYFGETQGPLPVYKSWC